MFTSLSVTASFNFSACVCVCLVGGLSVLTSSFLAFRFMSSCVGNGDELNGERE